MKQEVIEIFRLMKKTLSQLVVKILKDSLSGG
jgi:hypothetical protein